MRIDFAALRAWVWSGLTRSEHGATRENCLTSQSNAQRLIYCPDLETETLIILALRTARGRCY
jgi:hypothetical protein